MTDDSHCYPHLGVVVRDIVIDPHPPVRVESPGGLGQRFEKLQEPLCGLCGLPVVHVPGQQHLLIGDQTPVSAVSLSGYSSPGSVVAVAQHLLTRPQRRGEVVTGGLTHI